MFDLDPFVLSVYFNEKWEINLHAESVCVFVRCATRNAVNTSIGQKFQVIVFAFWKYMLIFTEPVVPVMAYTVARGRQWAEFLHMQLSSLLAIIPVWKLFPKKLQHRLFFAVYSIQFIVSYYTFYYNPFSQ